MSRAWMKECGSPEESTMTKKDSEPAHSMRAATMASQ